MRASTPTQGSERVVLPPVKDFFPLVVECKRDSCGKDDNNHNQMRTEATMMTGHKRKVNDVYRSDVEYHQYQQQQQEKGYGFNPGMVVTGVSSTKKNFVWSDEQLDGGVLDKTSWLGSRGSNKKKRRTISSANGHPGTCSHCGTTDTPEWRKGPLGPRSLCNACGLRYAKSLKTAKGKGQSRGQLNFILNEDPYQALVKKEQRRERLNPVSIQQLIN